MQLPSPHDTAGNDQVPLRWNFNIVCPQNGNRHNQFSAFETFREAEIHLTSADRDYTKSKYIPSNQGLWGSESGKKRLLLIAICQKVAYPSIKEAKSRTELDPSEFEKDI